MRLWFAFACSTPFHRVMTGFVVQGGGYSSGLAAKSGTLASIPPESNKGLTKLRGTLAMARSAEPNSATSQFHFNRVDKPALDYREASNPGYAVFDKIVKGLDIMDALGGVPTAVQNTIPDVPVTEVVVKIASRVR